MAFDSKTKTVIAGAFLYTVVMLFFSFSHHWGLRTQMNDLGNMDQAAWQASRGNLAMPVSNPASVRSRLSIHANFIFWPIGLFYWIWASPLLLLMINTLACTAAGLGLYAIGRRRLGNSAWSLVAPLAFWLNPMVQDANLYDFHTVTLATAFFVWMIAAFDSARDKTGWILFALALLCEEKIAVLMMAFGVAQLFDIRDRRRAVLIILISGLYLWVVLKVVVPLFNQGGAFTGISPRYSWLKTSGLGDILSHALQPDRLRLPLHFLVSGALAALSSWPTLLMLIPSALEGMLALSPWASRITGTYYRIIPAAIIALACIQSAEKAFRAGKKKPASLATLGAATLVLTLLFSPLPYGAWAAWTDFKRHDGGDRFEALARSIPAAASVCAQNNLGPHLSHRDKIFQVLACPDETDYALFYLRHVSGPYSGLEPKYHPIFLYQATPPHLVTAVETFVQSPRWALIAQEEGFYLFQRRAAGVQALPFSAEKWANDTAIFLDQASAGKPNRWLMEYLNGPISYNRFHGTKKQKP